MSMLVHPEPTQTFYPALVDVAAVYKLSPMLVTVSNINTHGSRPIIQRLLSSSTPDGFQNT